MWRSAFRDLFDSCSNLWIACASFFFSKKRCQYEENMKILSWWMIILILVGVALVSGLLFGLLGDLLGLSPSMKSGGMAACVGVAAAFLITRRRVAVNEQKNH